MYNVGGYLNRSAYNRANQFGPSETGFRGNARNFDLNRDFLKCDSENDKSFKKLFSTWKPDVFLDTHTTNGSDHQYSITLIPANPVSLPQPKDNFYVKACCQGCMKPRAKDSFFRWNFFDSMLDRREYSFPWGFEANAQQYLDEHPDFKIKREKEKANNPELKTSHYQQMVYLCTQSEWAEKSFRRYPVFGLSNVDLSWVAQ